MCIFRLNYGRNDMNILVPINNINSVSEYAKYGAKEYYLGFHDEQWREFFRPE